MQALTKIGHEDKTYPYLRQLRSWYRMRAMTPTTYQNSHLVATYLATKGLVESTAHFADMIAADNYLTYLIDHGRVTADNCPELFPIHALLALP
jgi:hypothetical protein